MTGGFVLVGSPQSFFGDDVASQCAGCGATLYRRPHGPACARVLCLACARRECAGQPIEVLVTAQTIVEVRAALEAMTSSEARLLLMGNN